MHTYIHTCIYAYIHTYNVKMTFYDYFQMPAMIVNGIFRIIRPKPRVQISLRVLNKVADDLSVDCVFTLNTPISSGGGGGHLGTEGGRTFVTDFAEEGVFY